ncbi:MAG: site-specific DNA-methyltransferase [Bacteroidales bacterium]|jgi:adenine-specific DNA-methyltransferase|nr:MAG: bfr:BF1158 methyltransferase [Parcubacteria bacterium 34_609]KUK99284.1 MAG: bfr:BF1158 methyltransferase [Parcubacteria bacterium 32_520]MBP8993394.1 site-specific DNA-methyltransferase [Bacteroidales bacterium]
MSKKLEVEKLKAEIERLKKELKKRKKYGLVWEEKPEEVVEMCKEKLPVLKEVKNKEIITDKDKPVNLLIEGDNYHALSVLNYTHAKKVDVIYIDPPYNTGNKDFIFNDHYVDKEDAYRHSKWLSFMEKRLKLAKNLLKDTGMIFISIDNNEIAQLKLLMDHPDLFGENNFEYFVWKKKGGAGNTERIIGTLTEFILCYFKKKKPGIFNYRTLDRIYKFRDEIGPYNLEGIEKTNLGVYERKTMRFPIIDPKTKKKFYPAKNMRWTIGAINAKKAIREGRLFFDHKKKKVYIIKRPEQYENSENVFYNLLMNVGSLATAKDELYNFFDNREIFDTPKPSSLIRHLLEVSSRKNFIILDFFAGSGTTAQAVLELNKEDGGNRKFILCTNNENNICTDVCYPRIKKVIEGYKNLKGEDVKGLAGNLKYFKTDFVDYNEPTDKNKIKLTKQATEMLCVREETFEKVLDQKSFKIFRNANHYTGIIFDQTAIPVFKKAIKDIKGKFSVYVFSLGDETFDNEFKDIKQKIQLSPIPEAILRVYRRIFK